MALSVSGGSLQFIAEIENSDFGRSIRQMEEQLRGLTQTANAQSSEMEGFAKKASLAIGSYLSFNAASDFVKQLIDVRSQFQALDVSFSTMLKSKSKADALMADVVKLAATTPFTLQEVGQGAKQLLAYGTSANKVVDTLKTLGDVASGVGAPIGDLVYLYGTLQTQGRAYTRDIMQFTSRGIPIIDELAKQFNLVSDATGTAGGKVQELVEAGKVGFPEIEKAFQSLTGAGGIFFNLMDKQSKTLNGQISNLKDSFAQMLNEIGKSQEGILAGGIGGLKTLVDNYETVADILKSILLTYGAYKTAIIVNTALQAIQTQSVLGYTLAEQLRLKAMLLSEGAMKVLRTAMLAMPTIALTAGIAAVTAAIYAMSTTSNAAAKALETIATIQSDAAQAVAKEKDTIEQLLSVYNDRNKSDADHATALQKLIALNPTYLSGLNANNIATKEGKDIIDKYLKSLEDKAKGEAAYAAKQANLLKIVDLQTKGIGAVDNTERLGRSLKRFFSAQKDLSGIEEDKAIVQGLIKELKTANDEIDKTFKEQITKTVLGDTGQGEKIATNSKRSLAAIEAEIKAIKERQTAESTSRQQYLEYQKQIDKLEKEAEAIRGATKKHLKDQETLEGKINALLEKRKNLLEQLDALKEGSRLTGVTKEESEVDKINNKYAQAVKDIDEYNKKVDAFNKKNKTKVSTIGSADLSLLNDAKVFEVQNALYRQQAEAFKKGLDEQKDIYTQYEEAKKTIGKEKADELFATQKQGFTSYLDYLKTQQSKLVAQATVGGMNVKIAEELKALSTGIAAEEKKNAAAAQDQLLKIIVDTQKYSDKKLAIETKYQADVAALGKNYTGEELQTRTNILKANRSEDLENLKTNLFQQSLLYKNLEKEIPTSFETMNQKILAGTKKAFEERKKLIEASLKQGYVIDIRTGEQIPLTTKEVEALKKALKDTNAAIVAINAQKFEQIAKYSALASNSFAELSSAIKPFNEDLAISFDQMSNFAGITANVATSFAKFSTGDVAGGISAAVGALSGVIKLVGSAFSNADVAAYQKQLEDFNRGILLGEEKINALYRQRTLEQAKLNKLKIDGLNAEAAALSTNLDQAIADYNRILDLIHKERFNTTVVDPNTGQTLQGTGVLNGRTFEQLQQLNENGQLTEGAKAYFEQLQALKEEIDSTTAAQDELKNKVKETFTGTTSDAILDSIVEGFANGKRATEDFADSFEDLMKKAILNSIKYQTLQKPLQDFYDQFAADAQSGGSLDTVEIDKLKNSYNEILENANKKFEELQKVTNVNFSSASSGNNTLTGAIKGISAQQADLLAGQFGGLRVSNLDILESNNKQLFTLNRIEANTAATVEVLNSYFRTWSTVGGLKVTVQ